MLYDIKQGRKHAAKDQRGMLVEPAPYCREKNKRCSDKTLFGFLTTWWSYATLSIGRKTNIPNAIRMVNKVEVIRLYISVCNKEMHTQSVSRPSERTLSHILNNCPASQRKSLAGLDNKAFEGSDAFDKLLTICKLNRTNYTEMHVKALTDS